MMIRNLILFVLRMINSETSHSESLLYKLRAVHFCHRSSKTNSNSHRHPFPLELGLYAPVLE
jgi:hypothetical protein